MKEFSSEPTPEPFDDLEQIPELSIDGLKSVLKHGLNIINKTNDMASRMTPDGTIPGDPLGHLELLDMRGPYDSLVSNLDTLLPRVDGRSWADIIAAETAEGRDVIADTRKQTLDALGA